MGETDVFLPTKNVIIRILKQSNSAYTQIVPILPVTKNIKHIHIAVSNLYRHIDESTHTILLALYDAQLKP